MHTSDHRAVTPQNAALWKSDFQTFTETLYAVAKRGKVPPSERLVQRYQANWESVKPITDGAGGLIETPPKEGTIGWKVNRHFAGQRVSWTITAAWDPLWEWELGDTLGLGPEEAQRRNVKNTRRAEVLVVRVPKTSIPEGLTINAGDEVVVEGRIGDANESTNLELSGVNAAYHYHAGDPDAGDDYVLRKGRTVFIVALEDAKVRLK
jgi:hypothetical protein